jgi:maltose/maltodextrin transport system permease protein
MEGLAISLFAILLFVDFAFLSPKGYPYRYTLPSIALLLVLTVFPIFYTISIAFTNYGTGHLLTREQVVESLLKEYVTDDKAEPYSYRIFMKLQNLNPTEDFIVIIEKSGHYFLAEKPTIVERDSKGNTITATTKMTEIINDQTTLNERTFSLTRSQHDPNRIIAINVYGGPSMTQYSLFFSFDDPSTAPNQKYMISEIFRNLLEKTEFYTLEGLILRFGTRYGFRNLVESRKKYRPQLIAEERSGKVIQRIAFINQLTQQPLEEKDGYFYDIEPNGDKRIVGGYSSYIGLYNIRKMFTDPRLSQPFLKIFTWTVTWAGLSVLFTFSIGLGLALILNNPQLKGKSIYRTLLIIPWAVPSFISVLVWRHGFFNETYGVINKFLVTQFFGLEAIRWLNNDFWAKASCLIVNTWLGFPYMMTVALGALQSIPHTFYEAASIDGAGAVKRFRKITFPLLMTSLAPLLVGSFAFNFNNFVGIYLLTNGGPEMPNSITNAGSTDILISYTYKLAFEGSRGQNFGYAAAVTLLIFLLVIGMSAVNFKLSGTFEEVNR